MYVNDYTTCNLEERNSKYNFFINQLVKPADWANLLVKVSLMQITIMFILKRMNNGTDSMV